MRAHIIVDGMVVNTIEVEALGSMPGLVAATEGSIGWSYTDGVFSPPVPAVPPSISRFKAKAALHNAGLLSQVEVLMTHPDTPMLAKLAWADALEFERASPTISAMTQALGLSDIQVDDLFRASLLITA
jgi:hypothetical protein